MAPQQYPGVKKPSWSSRTPCGPPVDFVRYPWRNERVDKQMDNSLAGKPATSYPQLDHTNRVQPVIRALKGQNIPAQGNALGTGNIENQGILHCPSKVVYTFLRRAIEIEIGIAIVIEMK